MRGKTLEVELQRTICEYLAYLGIFFWRSNNIPVFGRSGDGAMRFRRLPKYTPRGLPDIIVIINGHFVGLEVKREGFKQTTDQIFMQQQIEDNGGYYYVVSTLEDIRKIDFFKYK